MHWKCKNIYSYVFLRICLYLLETINCTRELIKRDYKIMRNKTQNMQFILNAWHTSYSHIHVNQSYKYQNLNNVLNHLILLQKQINMRKISFLLQSYLVLLNYILYHNLDDAMKKKTLINIGIDCIVMICLPFKNIYLYIMQTN